MTSRLRATLEATADGILVLDGNGRIANMNRRLAGLWGLPEALLARHDDQAILEHLIHAVEDPAALRTLLTTLNQLDNASFRAKRKLTIPFVKEILEL